MLDASSNEELMTFDSISDAARYLNKSTGRHHIANVCKGKQQIAYGYK